MKKFCNESELDKSINIFEPISLKEMKSVELLNRAETKYVFEKNILSELLQELFEYYYILEIKGKRKNAYHTVYFDTGDLRNYHKHHNGCLNRYKIRTREYLDSSLSFFEIKFKNNKGKTVKKRIRASEITNEAENFLREKSPYEMQNLDLTLTNNYTRITLVSKTNVERLTIDFNLKFINSTDESVSLPNVVIAEIKQDGFSQKSDFIKLMHKFCIRPIGFSKYCVGVSLLYDVKANNFKEKLLLVNKLGGVKNE